jgi:hypothetical protein
MSPILFAILLSGLERRLQWLFPTVGVALNGKFNKLSSYADDIKLFGCS